MVFVYGGFVDPVSEDWDGHSLYLPQYFMWRKLPGGRSEVIDVTHTLPGEYADPGMEPPSLYLPQYFTRRKLPRRKSKVLLNLRLKLDILYHMGR